VVPESPTTQDSSVEEQQQPGDQDTEDKTNEEHPPPSDTEASMGKSGTPETSRIATTFKDRRVKMGRGRNGLHNWVAPYPSWV
jgi:hypothetical protein